MKIVRVKKLFNDCISLRDHIVKKAIQENDSILVKFRDSQMFLGVNDLRKGKKSGIKIRSKWGDLEYELIDYKWEDRTLRLF